MQKVLMINADKPIVNTLNNWNGQINQFNIIWTIKTQIEYARFMFWCTKAFDDISLPYATEEVITTIV